MQDLLCFTSQRVLLNSPELCTAPHYFASTLSLSLFFPLSPSFYYCALYLLNITSDSFTLFNSPLSFCKSLVTSSFQKKNPPLLSTFAHLQLAYQQWISNEV